MPGRLDVRRTRRRRRPADAQPPTAAPALPGTPGHSIAATCADQIYVMEGALVRAVVVRRAAAQSRDPLRRAGDDRDLGRAAGARRLPRWLRRVLRRRRADSAPEHGLEPADDARAGSTRGCTDALNVLKQQAKDATDSAGPRPSRTRSPGSKLRARAVTDAGRQPELIHEPARPPRSGVGATRAGATNRRLRHPREPTLRRPSARAVDRSQVSAGSERHQSRLHRPRCSTPSSTR